MSNSMEKFKEGVQYVNVNSAVAKNELASLNGVNNELNQLSKVKFIPASGAATRMFRDLYTYLQDRVNTDFINYFFEYLENFAFYEELSNYIDFSQIDKNNIEDRVHIVKGNLKL